MVPAPAALGQARPTLQGALMQRMSSMLTRMLTNNPPPSSQPQLRMTAPHMQPRMPSPSTMSTELLQTPGIRQPSQVTPEYRRVSSSSTGIVSQPVSTSEVTQTNNINLQQMSQPSPVDTIQPSQSTQPSDSIAEAGRLDSSSATTSGVGNITVDNDELMSTSDSSTEPGHRSLESEQGQSSAAKDATQLQSSVSEGGDSTVYQETFSNLRQEFVHRYCNLLAMLEAYLTTLNYIYFK